MNKCERGQSQNEKPLRLEDLHQALQKIVNIGEDLTLDSLIKREGEEKAGLNLTSEIETNYSDIIRYTVRNDNVLENKLPISEKLKWRVNFGLEKDEEFKPIMSVILDNVRLKEEGIGELKIIAENLRRIYNLFYEPAIYYEGQLVKKLSKSKK